MWCTSSSQHMSAVLGPAGAAGATPRQKTHRRSVVFLRWLRKVHLWVGLWGAAVGLLFGVTGILLNHRAVLKIPVEKTIQRSIQLALPDAGQSLLTDVNALAAWLQAQLQFQGVQVLSKTEPARNVIWADREVMQPARWIVRLHSPQRGVNAEYIVGNRFVTVDIQDATPMGTLTRLHMATGANAFWVLLSDTIAAGLIVLCFTGLLLWSRLHTLRLAGIATSMGALTGAAFFLWSSA